MVIKKLRLKLQMGNEEDADVPNFIKEHSAEKDK